MRTLDYYILFRVRGVAIIASALKSKEKDSYEVICPSKELFDNFYKIDFKVFYCPNYINDQLFIDRGLESDSSQAIYIPYIGR